MTWSNWSGTVTASPSEVAAPVDAAAAAELLAGAAASGRRVRPLGSGHSFSAIGQPTDIAVSLAALTGVRSHTAANGRLWVGAGTRLRDLNRALDALGLALPNLGDIDRQTIAGAVATGTHGTGLRLHGIAAAVVGVELATASGHVLRCAPGDGTFEAARINLGALGIVTALELQAVPAFTLRAVEGRWRWTPSSPTRAPSPRAPTTPSSSGSRTPTSLRRGATIARAPRRWARCPSGARCWRTRCSPTACSRSSTGWGWRCRGPSRR